MKKFISTITAVLLSLCLCIGLVACGGGGGTHEGDHNTDDPYESTGEYHTVTFDSQGGSEVEAQTVLDGDYAQQPSRPEKAGSYFLHWSEEIEGERFVFTSRIITKDMTLYAVWGEAYTVTFDTQGGSDIPAQYVSPNTSARNPGSPTKEGFNFLGWYTQATGGIEWKWNDPVTGNITVYAHWESNSETEATASLEYTYDSTLNGYVVTGVGQESALRIPAEYNGTRGTFPVVGIGNRAFYNKRISSVQLPSSLVSIGTNAFTRTDLTSVTIPASVTTLGNYAFSECKALTSVTFEAGSQLKSIGQRAFAGTAALKTLTLPASVTSIGSYLLRDSGVTEIIFLGTRNAWNAIDKADNWDYGKTDVEVICLDDSSTSEPTEPTEPEPTEPEPTEPEPTSTLVYELNEAQTGYIVTGDNGQSERIIIPSKHNDLPVVQIANDAFAYSVHRSNITYVFIPDSVTEIGRNAFYSRQSDLVTVEIGQNSQLQKIGANAFSGARLLESIYIPASVTKIGDSAFNNCGSLEEIVVASDNAVYKSENGHLIEKSSNTLIRGGSNPVVPNGVQIIGEAAFSYGKQTTLTIPASVESIKSRAITDSAIESITFLGTETQWNELLSNSSRMWNMSKRNVSVTFVNSETAPTALLSDRKELA